MNIHKSEHLYKNLSKQGITINDNFPSFLAKVYRIIENTPQEQLETEYIINTIDELYKSINTRIFIILHRGNQGRSNKSTSLITSIYSRKMTELVQGKNLSNINELKEITSHESYSSISSMQNGKGIISYEDFKVLTSVKFSENESINKKIISYICSIQNGKGMIDMNDLYILLDFCRNGTNEIQTEILGSIALLQRSQGFKNSKLLIEKITQLSSENGIFDPNCLKKIAHQYKGKGINSLVPELLTKIDPKKNQIVDSQYSTFANQKFLEMDSNQNTLEKDFKIMVDLTVFLLGKMNTHFFVYLCQLQKGRGLPLKENILHLKQFSNKFPGISTSKLLTSIIKMYKNQGMPTEEDLAIIEKQISDIDGNIIEKKLLSLSRIQVGHGTMDTESYKDLMDFCNQSGKYSMLVLEALSFMQKGKGNLNTRQYSLLKDTSRNIDYEINPLLLLAILNTQRLQGFSESIIQLRVLSRLTTNEHGVRDNQVLISIINFYHSKGFPSFSEINKIKHNCSDENGEITQELFNDYIIKNS
ncbi:MAG: hypothetical protein GY828_07875 [Candidatus Gracilibacteria bacterium]|nr:hypothetical protein [Candidatus Gracilibacteria bacterium]